MNQHTVGKVDKDIFDISLEIKRLLYSPGRMPEVTAPTSESRGVKLPKIDVPTRSIHKQLLRR